MEGVCRGVSIQRTYHRGRLIVLEIYPNVHNARQRSATDPQPSGGTTSGGRCFDNSPALACQVMASHGKWMQVASSWRWTKVARLWQSHMDRIASYCFVLLGIATVTYKKYPKITICSIKINKGYLRHCRLGSCNACNALVYARFYGQILPLGIWTSTERTQR